MSRDPKRCDKRANGPRPGSLRDHTTPIMLSLSYDVILM